MDFNPNHPKWQCCCCHLASGLKILGVVEVTIASAVMALLVLMLTSDSKLMHPWTVFTGVALCLAVIVSSALLIVGIQKKNGQLLYPTLVVKGICIVVAHCLVAFNVLRPYQTEEARTTEQTPEDKPGITRLVFAIFVVMFVSVGIIYTMYLVVHCMRYLHGARRLEERRASVVHASQIIFE
uniref:DUF7027 domain-containing protein n=1 Tax=Plectus sambesii TaxID=2011161 RepID=A0A914WVR0_9BILA